MAGGHDPQQVAVGDQGDVPGEVVVQQRADLQTLQQRQNEIAKWVKSRQTPYRELLTSTAVDVAVELPYWNVRCPFT